MGKYCVYLTFYRGNRLPPFYIGSTSMRKIQNGYRGSVESNAFKSEWKMELYQNPHLFETIIISQHETREDAFSSESDLQMKLESAASDLFINRAIASRSFFFGGNHSSESKLKISKAMKGRQKSQTHCSKIAESLSGKSKSESHCASLKTAWLTRDRTVTTEQRSKISNSLIGRPRDDQSRKNISLGKKGKPQQKISCPKCGKLGGISAMKVHHFENCKW